MASSFDRIGESVAERLRSHLERERDFIGEELLKLADSKPTLTRNRTIIECVGDDLAALPSARLSRAITPLHIGEERWVNSSDLVERCLRSYDVKQINQDPGIRLIGATNDVDCVRQGADPGETHELDADANTCRLGALAQLSETVSRLSGIDKTRDRQDVAGPKLNSCIDERFAAIEISSHTHDLHVHCDHPMIIKSSSDLGCGPVGPRR